MMIRIALPVIVVAILLSPVWSWAAAAFVSQTEGAVVTLTSSATFSVTVPSGTDRAMVLCVAGRKEAAGVPVISSAVFNGSENLTLVRADTNSVSSTSHTQTQLWRLAAPTVTTANLVVTFNSSMDVIAPTVTLLTGVSQASVVDSHAGSTGSSTTASAIITTVADNAAIVDCAHGRADLGLTVGAGQTSRTDRIMPAYSDGQGVSTVIPKTPAGTETMDWTQSEAVPWATSVVSLTPSGGSDPNPVVPGQVTLTWVNGTDPGNPASGIINTTTRRCTGSLCAVATAGPGIGTVAYPQTTFIDNTVTAGTTYGYAEFHTDGVGLVSPNSGTVYITTSSTPPATPPTIIGAVADATGANLTYGSVTPTQIEVNIFSNTQGAISSVIHEISDFPAGRYTHTWLNGYDGVCFIPISAAGVKNLTASDYRCVNLTTIVGQLDTTPPTLTGCQPTTDLAAGTTAWDFSCLLDKPGAAKWSATADVAYADMANDLTTNGLTVSGNYPGLTNGTTRTIYLRAASSDIFDTLYPTTSDTPITITVASGGDVTPPGNVANNVCTVLGNAISCTWDAATGTPDGYIVYLSTDNVTFAPAGNPTALTNTILQLAFNTTYYIKIKALDAANNLSVAFSNTETKTTPLAPDNTPPTDLDGLAVEVFTHSVRASWITGTDTAGPVSTNLEYCLAEVGQTDCANFNITVSNIGQSFLTLNLLPGRLYCFRGKNADGSGNVSVNYSSTVCAETTTEGLSRPRPALRFNTIRPQVTNPPTAPTRPTKP